MKQSFYSIAVFLLFFGANAFGQGLSDAVVEQRKHLEEELGKIELEIGKFQDVILKKQQESSSLERDIAILDAQIRKTRLEIKSLELEILRLSGRIEEKEDSIDDINTVINRQKESLAESLKKLREYDDYALIEILLSHEHLSDFFGDVDTIDVIQSALKEQFHELRSTKNQEEELRDNFIEQTKSQIEARALLDIEKRTLAAQAVERKKILQETRGEEAAYQRMLGARRSNAASIRSQRVLLEGSPAIPFEKAVLFAERASVKTGVRVAFILGIIAQESELGRNIGQCNLPDDPPQYKWRAIMKPTRDHKPYLEITARLGLDPNLMPLSCPLGGGWGGAMGPAQFIPSTWLMFEDRIARATVHNPPNPWEPEDAFMASGLFLSELGATSISGEQEAAGRYFAGSRWNTSLGRRYASQVLAKVTVYQEQINLLKGLAVDSQ